MSARSRIQSFAVTFSIALHAALVAGARKIPAASKTHHAPTLLTIDVSEPAAPMRPAPPEPKPAEPPRESRSFARPAPEPTTQPEPPVVPDQPSGSSLTTDGASGPDSWLAPVGKGDNFVVSARVRPAIAPPAALPTPVRPRTQLVPPSDLSERLRPPPLDRELERAYPPEARQRGIGGVASVRVRIGPDGTVVSVQIVSESFPGFGAACHRTLIGSHWSAPRDRKGHAVATEIRYTCRFVVGSR